MWGMKKVTVFPAVVGALVVISTGFAKYVAVTEIKMKVEHAQKQPYLGQQGS